MRLRLGMVRAATLRRNCLEFAVRHLDGIEVGRIFRQVTQCRAHCFDSLANAVPRWTRQLSITTMSLRRSVGTKQFST